MRILIGALSCWQYNERRDRCRTTWMAAWNDYAPFRAPEEHTIAGAYFLIGVPQLKVSEVAARHLLLPGPDTYETLPQRTRAFCQWALQKDSWDYLFKCDDDTYVSIPRLIRYPLEHDYIGSEWTPGCAYGSGGAGYFLSRKAVEIVADNMTQLTGAEDVLVRDTLLDVGIRFHKDQRFVAYGSEDRRPKADNDLITLHGVEADLFYKSHEETNF